MQETDNQNYLNEVIDRFVKVYEYFPIFKCQETKDGIQAELYIKDLDNSDNGKTEIVGPVCIGFCTTPFPATNEDYLIAMINSVANFDLTITDLDFDLKDR